ncbi:MAG: superoxide dismutase [Arenimonas sp.]
MPRRQFLKTASAGAAIAASSLPRVSLAQATGPHELPKLPYAENALAPVISANTIGFHYGKHHAGYIANLNNLLQAAPELAALKMEELIKTTAANPNRTPVFNNAAQVWNHTFYWNCLAPNGGGEPAGRVADAINKAFGSFAAFKEQFTNTAVTTFGSGWAWLVQRPDGSLGLVSTPNAATPITGADKPLLTCDVWEHAYDIDFRNARPKYVEAFWNLVNWNFVAGQLG